MIDWVAKFYSIEKSDGEEFNVNLCIDDNDGRYIGFCSFKVPLNKYPEFKVLQKDHLIRVVGRIAKISDLGFASIEEPALFFLPAKSKN